MSEVAVQASTPEQVVSALIMQLSEGQVEDAIAFFAEDLAAYCFGGALQKMGRL